VDCYLEARFLSNIPVIATSSLADACLCSRGLGGPCCTTLLAHAQGGSGGPRQRTRVQPAFHNRTDTCSAPYLERDGATSCRLLVEPGGRRAVLKGAAMDGPNAADLLPASPSSKLPSAFEPTLPAPPLNHIHTSAFSPWRGLRVACRVTGADS